MSPRAFPVSVTLEMLAAGPRAIRDLVAPAPDARRRARPGPDAWSAHEIFAHLRACADVWGGHIRAILADHPARLGAGDPRAWAADRRYADAEFQDSFAVYLTDREALLALLRNLPEEGWASSALMVGSATRVERSVHWHADHIARHEEQHVVQMSRVLRAVARG